MIQHDPPTTAEIALLIEIRDLLRTLVRHSPAVDRRALTAEDRRALATLLPSISRAIGDAVFTVADLLEHAETDDELRYALGSASPRSLGKLFARSTSRVLDGVRVERVGPVREGVLWRVTRL